MAASEKAVTKPPRGTRDFLPSELYRRQYVLSVIRDVYEAHGFQPLETPTFERLDTLTGKYGDEGDQLMFKILHRGQTLVDGIRQAQEFLQQPGSVVVGRSGETAPGAERLLSDLGLRYDLTVPLARVIAEYSGKLPTIFKRYQLQPVWRADTPGKARYREFVQCDVDVVGSTSILVEAEVCGAVASCFERLGFDNYEIRVNHRALLRAFIETAQIPIEREADAIVAVDKLDKVGPDGVQKELRDKGLSDEMATSLMTMVLGEADIDRVSGLMAQHEAGAAAVEQVGALIAMSADTPAGPRLKFDPTLARGLGYYTGCIFEIRAPDLGSSLGGGGRYDGLVGMFSGRDIPACGFSIGLDRLIFLMEARGLFPDDLGAPEVLVATTEKTKDAEVVKVAYALRQEGFRVDLWPKADKPGKLRKMADDRGINALVLIRRDEGEANVWLRADPKATDRVVPVAELTAVIRQGANAAGRAE